MVYRTFVYDVNNETQLKKTEKSKTEYFEQFESFGRDWMNIDRRLFDDSVFNLDFSINDIKTSTDFDNTIMTNYQCTKVRDMNETIYNDISYKLKNANKYAEIQLPEQLTSKTQFSLEIHNNRGDILYSLDLPYKQTIQIEAEKLNNYILHNNVKQYKYLKCTDFTCTPCKLLFNGDFQNGNCTITRYTKGICILIKENIKNDGKLQEAEYSLFKDSDNNSGCFYHSEYVTWNYNPLDPREFTSFPPNEFTVVLRHYKDPYTLLSREAKGCTSISRYTN